MKSGGIPRNTFFPDTAVFVWLMSFQLYVGRPGCDFQIPCMIFWKYSRRTFFRVFSCICVLFLLYYWNTLFYTFKRLHRETLRENFPKSIVFSTYFT